MLILGSWSPGLESDNPALDAVRTSPYLDGIETADAHATVPPLQAAGVLANLHNPTRWGVKVVSKPDFLSGNFERDPGLARVFEAARGPVLGFHLPSYIEAGERGRGTLDRTVRHAAWLAERFPDHRVALEIIPAYTRPTPHDPDDASVLRLPQGATPMTDPQLLVTLLDRLERETDGVGFLVDMAHTLVGLEHTLRPASYADLLGHFEDVIEVIGRRTWQFHVNAPAGTVAEGLMDVHRPLQYSPNRSLVLAALDIAARRSPHVQALTLEVESGLEPSGHVRILDREACMYVRPVVKEATAGVAA